MVDRAGAVRGDGVARGGAGGADAPARDPAAALRLLRPEVLARLGSLELVARTVVDGVMTGLHRSPHFGHSQEFAEYRAYNEGDDLRFVDWNVYARTGRAYVKRFRGDTSMQMNLLVDASASMGFGDPVSKLDVARWLHGLGADPDARGSNGWSAATIAAAKGLDATLGWLLSIGADVDRADVYGFTPLMRAVDNGHADVARRLLAADVDVDAADESGNTALHHAVAGGRATLVRLLLDRGADASARNRDGLTPSDLVRSPAPSSDGRPRRALPAPLAARLRQASSTARR